MNDLHRKLLDWYKASKRDLPWRRTKDPYAIWISEIMLQQTQIVTALPYYERWMERFPTVESLAATDDQQALSIWQGLGYYRRCRMLLQAAKQIVKSGMPTSRDEWLKVSGVGKYTAGAIASIAFNEQSAVVDGNVERVYSRLTCDPATGPQLNSNTWQWADIHVHQEEPGEWNQAVMELGATVCKPVKPVCHICPVKTECQAFKTNRVEKFPSPKVKPTVIRIKEEIYLPIFGDEIGLQKDHDQKWWKGMSLLPLSATHSAIFEDEWKEEVGRFSYTVTNHKITASVQLIRVTEKNPSLLWVPIAKIGEVPIPSPHRKALKLYYRT